MATETSVSFGSFRLDSQNACVWRDAAMIKLTPKAFAVLHYLIERPGRLVTKDELFTAVWPDTVVSDVALSVCIRELRKSLEDEAKTPQYIETVYRRGFRFIGKVVSSQHSVGGREEEERQETNSENIPEPRVQSLESETQDVTLASNQTLNARRQTLDGSAPARSWPNRNVAWLGVVLLVSAGMSLFYFSSLRIPPAPSVGRQSEIRNQGEVPSPLPLPDKPSIIVLPFVNLSGDPGQEYFSDGITEVLTTDLSKIASLFVIARNSAFTYKGKAVKVQEVSKEMGVRYVLEGSVLRADGQVRITAQLIDATTGYHLWSERYDRPLKDIFAVQDEIVRKIVTTLKLQIPLMEQGYMVRKRTDNLEAYDAFLHGVEFYRRAFSETNKELHEQAQQMFEKAIALDPQFAEAYVWLGRIYWLRWFYGWNPTLQTLEQAGELAQRAIALDDSLPMPHWVLGLVYVWKKQHDQAIVEAERAIALGPNDAEGYFGLGDVLVFAGRPEEGIGLIKKAMRLNPRYPITYLLNLGWAYRVAGQCEEAIVLLKKLLIVKPDFLPSHINLASCYAEMDRLEEAQAEAAAILRLMPTWSLEGARRHWPYKDPAALEHHLAALRKAGLK